ncbi:hypothetical protein [Bacillus mycoides]|uniref:hypothetical protein n=1 Tax=Bacillus mycoides TaxID=1405 RepID=UPI003A7FAE40
MELIYKKTYSEHYDLEAVIERCYDSFPEEWGELEDNEIEKDSHVSGIYEATDVMANGLKIKVEIYHSDDAEEEDTWVCAAYKIS